MSRYSTMDMTAPKAPDNSMIVFGSMASLQSVSTRLRPLAVARYIAAPAELHDLSRQLIDIAHQLSQHAVTCGMARCSSSVRSLSVVIKIMLIEINAVNFIVKMTLSYLLI